MEQDLLLHLFQTSAKVKSLLSSQRVGALQALCAKYNLEPAKSGVRGTAIKPDYVNVLIRFHSTLPILHTDDPKKRRRLEEPSITPDQREETPIDIENLTNTREDNLEGEDELGEMELDTEFPEPLDVLWQQDTCQNIDAPLRIRTSNRSNKQIVCIRAFENKYDTMPRTELLLELEENGDLDLTRVQLAFEEPRACRILDPRLGNPFFLPSPRILDGFVRNIRSQRKGGCIFVTFNPCFSRKVKSY